MKKRSILSLAALTLNVACGGSPPVAPAPALPPPTTATSPSAPVAAVPSLPSGLDTSSFDRSVRPEDDLYQYVNAAWLARTEIPSDKPEIDTFVALHDQSLAQLREIAEAAAKDPLGDPELRQVGEMYASFMDEARVESLGVSPVLPDFARVDALRDKRGLVALMGAMLREGRTLPLGVSVHQDNKDATKYVVDFQQSGLGLPDRDYYLKDDDAKLKDIRAKYGKHVERMLRLAGDKNAAANAKAILTLETELARIQWTKVLLRDPVKAYNKTPLAKLAEVGPGIDWSSLLRQSTIAGKVDYVIVGQPSYVTGLAKLLDKTPLATWKAYLKWHALSDRAPLLAKRFADANFDFYGTTLTGVPEQRPRWKRALGEVEAALGEQIGKRYVARFFPPEGKARAEALVQNLLATFKEGIDELDWMSPATKKEAQAKLAKFTPKLAYPSQFRDYTKLTIAKDDLVGNVERGQIFEFDRNIAKLGKPIDRAEWGMTPQTINAYYNPELNEIVFPAAILQPPFFDPKVDDAVNYGGIGMVIGHEISHGFDDQGCQYDGDGNLRDWWTAEDHDKFAAKTKALVDEYSAFEPVPGYKLNGELTLGENIADNSGLAVAYKAYQRSLGGRPAPVIDGLTGDQRFFLGFARVWHDKIRDNAAIARVKSDPHSPDMFRVKGTLPNQPAFYAAFGLKPGDKLYVAPERRVTIW